MDEALILTLGIFLCILLTYLAYCSRSPWEKYRKGFDRSNTTPKSLEWIDNADSYICPLCGYETGSPNIHGRQCPQCGFVADRDKQQ